MQRARYAKAVGLHYASGSDETPSLGVCGEMVEADRIVAIAQRFGVPVVEDSELTGALSALDLDQCIPAPLYRAVAVLLTRLERL